MTSDDRKPHRCMQLDLLGEGPCNRTTECSRVKCPLRKEITAAPPGYAPTFPSEGRTTPKRGIE